MRPAESVDSSYRVEISGWDAWQNFFVEITWLFRGPNDEARVTLRHAVREGAMVFVRVLDAFIPVNNFPIAFLAQQVSPAQAGKPCEAVLTPLWPGSVTETTGYAAAMKGKKVQKANAGLERPFQNETAAEASSPYHIPRQPADPFETILKQVLNPLN